MITYGTCPDDYRHWKLTIEPPVATLILIAEVQWQTRLDAEIELSDAVQRLRFEHPDVGAVVVTGDWDKAFTAPGVESQDGLLPSDVATFCNEVRCAIEDASANSGLRWLAVLDGSASGPGYELALAMDEILLVDDGCSTVSLPGISVHGTLPVTGGLTRLVEKRRVRPDLIDAFCARPAGVRGTRAQDWGLVDMIAPRPHFAGAVRDRALTVAGAGRGAPSEAVVLNSLPREDYEGGFSYPNLRIEFDHQASEAAVTLVGPANHECFAPEPGPMRLRSRWWPLAVCRELDDALLLLRTNWPGIHTLVLRTEGDPLAVASADVAMTSGHEHDWFVREVVLYWQRTLKRLELMRHSVIALIEPGSCFVGTLLELAFAADRAYILDGTDPGHPELPSAEVLLTEMNFGPLRRINGLTRLQTRFLGREVYVDAVANRVGDPIGAGEAVALGLVTASAVEAEWSQRTRQAIEERAGLAPDVVTGLASSFAVAGPATLETKIFAGFNMRI